MDLQPDTKTCYQMENTISNYLIISGCKTTLKIKRCVCSWMYVKIISSTPLVKFYKKENYLQQILEQAREAKIWIHCASPRQTCGSRTQVFPKHEYSRHSLPSLTSEFPKSNPPGKQEKRKKGKFRIFRDHFVFVAYPDAEVGFKCKRIVPALRVNF